MSAFEQAAANLRGQLPTVEVQGASFVLRGWLSTLDVSELGRSAGLDSESPEGAALLADIFRTAFGADPEDPDHTREGIAEYRRFLRHVRRLGDEVMMEALAACVVAFSGFPTGQPSASSPSPSASTPGWKGAGSPPAAPERTPLGLPPAPDVAPVVVNIGRRAS